MYHSGKGLGVVCQWNLTQFGEDDNTSKDVTGQWFVLYLLNNDEQVNQQEILEFCHKNSKMPVSLEIIEYYYLHGNEMVAVCKTFWLRLIQRKWKQIYAERLRITKIRQMPKSLIYRELNGHWDKDISTMPSLKGMMT